MGVDPWHFPGDVACVGLGSWGRRASLAVQSLAQNIFLADFNLLCTTLSFSKCFLPSGEVNGPPHLREPLLCDYTLYVSWRCLPFPMTTLRS